LTSGVITTGSNKIIITDPNASSLSNGSTTSFINGNLRREIGTNTDTYTFPIGNGTGASKYHRVDMINNNLSGVNHIDATVGDMPAGDLSALNTSQIGSDLVELFDRQWQLTPNVQPSGGSYGVNLYLNGVSGMVIDDNNFTVVKRDDGSTSYADWKTHEATTTIPQSGQAGRTVASGYGQKTGFTSFSLFGFGGTGGSALPIDLVSFDGKLVLELEPFVLLNWVVASQINNDYFSVERSENLEEWTQVGKVYGVGNTSTQMSYRWVDGNPMTGVSYYRLSQTDYDGRSESFAPIAITFTPEHKVLDKVVNYMGQEVNEYYKGMVLEVYTDGTYVKKYYE